LPPLVYKYLIISLKTYIKKYVKNLNSKKKKIYLKQLTPNFYYCTFSSLRVYISCEWKWWKKATLAIANDIWSLLWFDIATCWNKNCFVLSALSIWKFVTTLWRTINPLLNMTSPGDTHDCSLNNCSSDVCLHQFSYVCLVRWIMWVNYVVYSTFAMNILRRTWWWIMSYQNKHANLCCQNLSLIFYVLSCLFFVDCIDKCERIRKGTYRWFSSINGISITMKSYKTL